MKQLSGLDTAFLAMETSSTFGHVSALSLYERPPDDPDFEPMAAFRAKVIDSLAILEPFRRRLVEVPLSLDRPYWVLDPDFDLDAHLRHISVPPPGDDHQVAEQVALIAGRPIDRSRPLWEVYVLEGLADGGFAVVTKFHHATIDGASAAQFTTLFHDGAPTELDPPGERADRPTEPIPGDAGLLWRTAQQMARRPGQAVRLGVRGVRAVAAATRASGVAGTANLLARELPGPAGRWARRTVADGASGEAATDRPPPFPTTPAPPTPFNRAITADRSFAYRSVALDDVRAVKVALGCTVNDVVMAVCAGALRRYLLRHDALPDEPLVASVPVSTRTGDEADPWTNRVSTVFAGIPTDEPDPLARVAAAGRAMGAAKEHFDLIPADLLAEAADFVPFGLVNQAMRIEAQLKVTDHVRLPFNLIISNVPGARQPLYLGGARLTHYHPCSALADGQGLNITVWSYCDSMDLGFVACPSLVPDLWDLIDDWVDELAELVGMVGVVGPTT